MPKDEPQSMLPLRRQFLTMRDRMKGPTSEVLGEMMSSQMCGRADGPKQSE